MSINDFFNKIKGKYAIDNITIMYLCVIIGVGVSSFCLGRLSVDDNKIRTSGVSIVNTKDISNVINSNNNINTSTTNNINQIKEKRYVSSKNGKLYYPISCNGAKRIAEKNKVWFESSVDAEKLGYTLASGCK